MFRSGFISVIGRSNIGKSTLLNRIIGEHLAIISNRPQTTRQSMEFILTTEDYQMIFVDTPGIQKPKNKLGKYMLSESKSQLFNSDIVTYMVDHSDFIGEREEYILRLLKDVDAPIILLINKVDLIDQNKLIEIVHMYKQLEIFDEILPISALDGFHVKDYIEVLEKYLPEGPMYYEEDQLTNISIRDIVGEMIREQTLNHLREEIPHGIYVEVDLFKQREGRNFYDIEATIYVEKNSHKGMVIGKNGQMLKKIGMNARKTIEHFLDARVHLQCWIRVDDNWRNKDRSLKDLGFQL